MVYNPLVHHLLVLDELHMIYGLYIGVNYNNSLTWKVWIPRIRILLTQMSKIHQQCWSCSESKTENHCFFAHLCWFPLGYIWVLFMGYIYFCSSSIAFGWTIVGLTFCLGNTHKGGYNQLSMRVLPETNITGWWFQPLLNNIRGYSTIPNIWKVIKAIFQTTNHNKWELDAEKLDFFITKRLTWWELLLITSNHHCLH